MAVVLGEPLIGCILRACKPTAADCRAQEGEPNRFCYGNKVALDLFETTWDELVGTESTQSAEDVTEVRAGGAGRAGGSAPMAEGSADCGCRWCWPDGE